MSRYRSVYCRDSEGRVSGRFDDVGINADGTLHNPRGYPQELVRAAVLAADQRRHERRSKAAKQAAETRHIRIERRVYETAGRILANQQIGPRNHCYVCGRGLTDAPSIACGIGPECWQDIMNAITRRKAENTKEK